MIRIILRVSSALALFGMVFVPLAASAHQTITAGDYVIEYGWLNEPPIVGQPNAIVINFGAKEGSGIESGEISLISPTDGAKITGDHVDVSVRVENVDPHTPGAHWHLYLDDHSLAMIPVGQPTVTLRGLTNGMHTLKVVLAAADHSEKGAPATAMITVEGAADTGLPSVSGVEAMETEGRTESVTADISKLKLEVVYGPERKVLNLQPLGEDTPGQFIAPLAPTRAGEYTLELSGKLNGDLGEADVSAEVKPEEVESAATVQFPGVAQGSSQNNPLGLAGWLGLGGLIAGLVGIGLGVYGIMKKK